MTHCLLCGKLTAEEGLCDACTGPLSSIILTEKEGDMEMKTCAYEGCDEEFEPTNNRQKFCPKHSSSPGVVQPDETEMIKIIRSIIDSNADGIRSISVKLKSGLTVNLSQE